MLSKCWIVNSKARAMSFLSKNLSHCGTPHLKRTLFSRNWHSTSCLICSSCTKSFGSFTFENSQSLFPNLFWFRPSAARLSGLAGHFWNQQEPKPPCAIEPLRLPSPLGVVVIFPGQQGINGGIYSTFVPRQRSQAGGLCEARLGHPRG